jgi:dephospho-CoA kinase
MWCVGLTGGIGSGKTTVAGLFAALGVWIIDADVIAHALTEPGAAGHAKVAAHFGPAILTADGRLDRQALRGLIARHSEAKTWLENTLHPLILADIRRQIQQIEAPYCLVVIPLLAESALRVDFLDRVCVVDAPEALRKHWAAQRDQVCVADIEAIIAIQSPREKRLALADDVIVNDQDLSALKAQVQKLHQQYLQMAAKHHTPRNAA